VRAALEEVTFTTLPRCEQEVRDDLRADYYAFLAAFRATQDWRQGA